jgi:hypothetical protein
VSTALQVTSVIPSLLAAAILHADRRIFRRLRAAGAEDAARAVPLAAPHALARWRLARLVSGGAIKVAGAGEPPRYYVDEAGVALYRRSRRYRALVMVGVVAALFAVWLLVGSRSN